MKVKIEGEKIIKAVKKLEGIEIVLENNNDAKEAIDLILKQIELPELSDINKLKDVGVTSFQEYNTSAVQYKMIFLLEFLFEDNLSSEAKVALIKEIQNFFAKI